MSRFEVSPDTLAGSAGAAAQIGDGLHGLAGLAAAAGQGDGLPPATEAALGTFGSRAAHHVASLGAAAHALGAAVGAAADLYTETDATVIR
jgi:hypothetical protein